MKNHENGRKKLLAYFSVLLVAIILFVPFTTQVAAASKAKVESSKGAESSTSSQEIVKEESSSPEKEEESPTAEGTDEEVENTQKTESSDVEKKEAASKSSDEEEASALENDASKEKNTSSEEEDTSSDTSANEEILSMEREEEITLERYEISTKEELIAFAQRVNQGDSMEGYLVVLQRNISLTEPWTPIGAFAATPFSGSFDGQGYSIQGLSVAKDTVGGLFGYLSQATVKNVALTNVQAPRSTAGIFYSATSSTVELSEKQQAAAANSRAALARQRGSAPWGGVGDVSDAWRSGATFVVVDTYEIYSAAELADFAQMVNNGAVEEGVTIVLKSNINLNNKAWEPIGRGVPFAGHFVGENHRISNLSVNLNGTYDPAGLFSEIAGYDLNEAFAVQKSSSISGVVLDNANITAKVSAGGIAGSISDTSLTNNIVTNSVIFSNSDDAGGIVGFAGSYDKEMSLNNNIVHNAKITSSVENEYGAIIGGNAGGIAGSFNGSSINQNIVSNSTLCSENDDYGELVAGGIVGLMYGSSTVAAEVSQNLVLGVAFSEKTETAIGIGFFQDFSAPNLEAAAVNNNFVSGLQLQRNAAGNTDMNSLYYGAAGNFYGAEHNGTDAFISDLHSSPSNVEFFEDAPLIVNNNFWDKNSSDDSAGALLDEQYGNKGYFTNYLTTGRWVPTTAHWTGSKNNYPQLTHFATANSSTISGEYARKASALAATAIHPVYEEDIFSYQNGARGIRLYRTAANGDTIQWNVSGTGIIKDESHADYIQYDTDSTAQLKISASLSTPMGTITKHFDTVKIIDGILKEDKTQRIDHNFTPDNPPLITLDQKIQLTYLEDIEANADVTGNAELWVKRADGKYHLVQSIPVDSVSNNFTITGQRIARVNFTLTPGNHYKAIFPKGFVVESGKNNQSESATVYFKTDFIGLPEITLAAESIIGTSTLPMTVEEITKGVAVYRNTDRNEVLYNGATDGAPTRYTGAWDSENPVSSANKAAESLAPNAVEYYIEEHSRVISNTPSAGIYQLYILAKNAQERYSYRAITVVIEGQPQWADDNAPLDKVHIPWTKDIDTLKTAAKQGCSAVVLMNDDYYVPVPVRVEVPTERWDSIVKNKTVPAEISVAVNVLTQSGDLADISTTVTVYLDKELAYNLAPSPIVMSYSTPRQVEEIISFQARNFGNNEVKFDHWTESYRKPGLYRVGVYTDPLNVTKCTDKKCTLANHPQDHVSEAVEFFIHEPVGPEIESFWGDISKEIEDATYTRATIETQPKSYLVPSYVLNLLREQGASKMQVSFFDQYRWNIYGSTLDTNHAWGESYSLRMFLATNDNINSLLEDPSAAIQILFQQEGKLFGATEFELNLEKFAKHAPNLPKEDLGLYRYNPDNDSLVLVSDLLIDSQGRWASALLDELLPTTYVVKAKETGDTPAASVLTTGTRTVGGTAVKATATNHYETLRNAKEYDQSKLIITTSASADDLFGGQQIDTTTLHSSDTTQSTTNYVALGLLVLAAVVLVAGLVTYIIIGKGKNEDEV